MNHQSPVPTPHNEAKMGDIAKTVLMPGDPLRAKYISDTYLEDAVCFNNVRGMLGFTGKYKGVEVSVMGSGMGMPSMGIYSYELFDFYGVENIIRIGSCGAYLPEIKVYDIILATESRTESTFAQTMSGVADKVLYPSKELIDAIVACAGELSIEMTNAPIHSSDVFYNIHENYYKAYAENGTIAVDMESFALFANANVLGKRAACILTVSDNIATQENVSSEKRQIAFNKMMEVALAAAIKL